MGEDEGVPPSRDPQEHVYCQRCGDTLPPFVTITTLRSMRTSRAEPDGRHTCPGCGEPAGR